jgi:hypothetical protein
MRIWFDTEFIDTGNAILLLSIGAIREDDATYYAEPHDTPIAQASDWVRTNVLPLMARFDERRYRRRIDSPIKPRPQIAEELIEFAGTLPEWWAYVDSYDWIALSQLYGPLTERPMTWPMRSRDVRELFDLSGMKGEPEDWVPAPRNIHHALSDAKWDRALWHCIQRYARDHDDFLEALVLT